MLGKNTISIGINFRDYARFWFLSFSIGLWNRYSYSFQELNATLLNYLFIGPGKCFPCRRRIRIYNILPSDAFCFQGLFKIYFFLKAHLETCYCLLCLPATSKEPVGITFFFLNVCFHQRKKKGNENYATSKPVSEIDSEKNKIKPQNPMHAMQPSSRE